MHQHCLHPWQRGTFAYGTPGRWQNSTCPEYNLGFAIPVPQPPWALQNFVQMPEFTHPTPHRAPRDTRELAEQDVIKTEAFQNSPSELQKRKKKGKKKPTQNPRHWLPGEFKMSHWRIKELLTVSVLSYKEHFAATSQIQYNVSAFHIFRCFHTML